MRTIFMDVLEILVRTRPEARTTGFVPERVLGDEGRRGRCWAGAPNPAASCRGGIRRSRPTIPSDLETSQFRFASLRDVSMVTPPSQWGVRRAGLRLGDARPLYPPNLMRVMPP